LVITSTEDKHAVAANHTVRNLPKEELRAIKDWVQQFRCCTEAKFRSTFHIIDMYLELLNHSCG